ncbi:DUF1203 domain-containing protein [Luteimonas sp. SDU101]|uniref:DUF1203 domain-containing protein n=1 Tax=Luteimonas sp. SDU101 TaxID=3422593 RepID=UPI003EBD70EC
MTFRLSGLDPAPFAPLFALDDASLARHGARRVLADRDSGYPCRVGLADALVGDELLLLHWEHVPGATPYRASGPIFVRRHARRRVLAPGEVPPYVSRRLMSLRAYDAASAMVDACVCEGGDVASELTRLLDDAAVSFVHLHNARRGCYSCVAHRA